MAAPAAEVTTDQGAGARPRALEVGAEAQPGGGVHFRVWAPRSREVDVVLEAEREVIALAPEGQGYFSGFTARAGVGTRYRYGLGDGRCYPDPASRFQPEGPHGASQVIDPRTFRWTDGGWGGVELPGQILYEMHIGTYTPEGTFEAARRELSLLAGTGITVVELMPVAEFAGRFGWGYDGVDLFAPSHLYGAPDDLRRFVDTAHALGVGVILDVVYNHLGPDGNYLTAFSGTYFTDRYDNEWGDAVNFDGPGSAPVRELVLANARYWIDEFHLDGLRLDATQQIFDASHEHVLTGIARAVRGAARGRRTIIVAESEPQHPGLVRPAAVGGHGLDGLWNDDFHHSAAVALTGRREAYYRDYAGTPQELISALKWGYLYQGQRSAWQKQPRGRPALDIPHASFITFIENHDQVANSGHGARTHQTTSPGRHRAMTALLLLGPGTPMLFQGQEFSATSPFLYFADHAGELGASVRRGRHAFLAQFPSLASQEMAGALVDPGDARTFERSKLDLGERERHRAAYALHRDLIRLRRSDPVFGAARSGGIDGAVLGRDALLIRFLGQEGDDRLLLVNLGREVALSPAPEPLLAPPEGRVWDVLWSSESPRYGGSGTAVVDGDGDFRLPAEAAVVLWAVVRPAAPPGSAPKGATPTP
ncbi:MAG TPA: malto-oligosyltrehalose trehalohydrolase [Candidatus Binatia bacterium]|nr:malto-oligosyltrehalose trehalohydrolase [Candidatus Binatia bacterium]